MRQIVSTVSSKGQVTIPAAVRALLGLEAGDKLIFRLDDDGAITLTTPRYPTVASLQGAAGSLREPLSWHEMREIAREDREKARFGVSE